MSKRKKVAPPAPSALPKQSLVKELDLNDAFTQLIQNNNTIAEHIKAIRLVAKGIDISGLETANRQNAQILLSLAQWVQSRLPGKGANRQQRRAGEKALKKAQKKKNKTRK